MDERGETLLIHLGGLGDVCVSESAFLSLRRHYGNVIRAVGNKRVLDQFTDRFTETDSIDSRTWSYLFSDSLEGPPWPRIVLFGKDRQGAISGKTLPALRRADLIRHVPGWERACPPGNISSYSSAG